MSSDKEQLLSMGFEEARVDCEYGALALTNLRGTESD